EESVHHQLTESIALMTTRTSILALNTHVMALVFNPKSDRLLDKYVDFNRYQFAKNAWWAT
ncbi:MAG: hypothetical protein ACREYE_26340, partial [Gammaproteobacteria bacterium]